jgi:hypothetical protein
MLRGITRAGEQGSEAISPSGFLPTRRHRPSRGAAEQRDELAPLQLIELHLLPQPGDSEASYRIGEDQGRGSLQCEISARLMTGSGQTRRIDKLPTLAACPLRPESGRVGRHLAKSALCQEATYASQQTRAVIRSRRLRAAREIQPTLRPGFRGMKCGFRRRATAGRHLTGPSALS